MCRLERSVLDIVCREDAEAMLCGFGCVGGGEVEWWIVC